MIKNKIDAIKQELEHVLYLNLDEFRLEAERDEVLSRFIGLRLRSEFQPIFDTGRSEGLLGYEALLRPSTGIEAVTPGFAFSVADSEGKLVKLDRVARTLHMLNYLTLPEQRGLLFLNVHPKLLVSVTTHGKVFEHILHQHSVPTRQVVIEINESQVDADGALLEAIDNYRDRGYRIALDDFGSQHSNLNRLWKLSPDFVKLDLTIIKQAQRDTKLRRALPKLIDVIHALGAQTIIEGIENEIQLDIALDAGAKLLQGYYLGRPAAAGHWGQQSKPFHDNVLMPGAPHHFGSFSVPAQCGM
ncbi:EAL domain-containing protein [Methylomonas sp. LL1]|uniref:EAL domain-containing protein n=1 Tax=Methylomonas sp. LL1 TaxID=2785785 RepID=UPI0018C3AF32|nr:EAL domain-containing protein [Methylomonas sp. LL1]QPK62712.1 EAL domain-containing protein [Methylomonas sp. LL1]